MERAQTRATTWPPTPSRAARLDDLGPCVRRRVGGLPEATFEKGEATRTVVIEFESVEAAVAAHDSVGYQEALRALGDGAERDLRVVPVA